MGTVLSFFALVVSALAYARTLALDAVTAELFVEREPSGTSHFVLVIDNPTRRSLLLNKVRLRTPSPDQVGIAPKDSEIRDDLYRAYQDPGDEENLLSVYLRVPPCDKAELQVNFQRNDTGFSCQLVWSPHLPRRVRWLLPKKLDYDANTLTNMRMAR